MNTEEQTIKLLASIEDKMDTLVKTLPELMKVVEEHDVILKGDIKDFGLIALVKILQKSHGWLAYTIAALLSGLAGYLLHKYIP